MNVNKLNVTGNPYIGLFCSTNDKFTLTPSFLKASERKIIIDVLGTEVVSTSFHNSSLAGVFSVGNTKSFIVSTDFSEEVESLQASGIPIKAVECGHNALGNLVACNDKGCLISSVLVDWKAAISEALEVSVTELKVAGVDILGSCIVGTNKGFLVNPNADESEFKVIKKVLGVDGVASTANFGDNFVSHSVLANSNGVLVGELTSGPELMRITDGLNLE